MSTLSPRAGLILMADSDFVDPSPVTSNAQKMDSLTSVVGCTSASRPASPINGQWIYETDTQNVRRWTPSPSSKWYLLGGSGNNSSSGYVGSANNTSAATLTASSGSGHNQISLHDYNFSLKNNKQYKVIEQGWIWLTGSFTNTLFNYNVGLWTNFGVGANPSLTGAAAVHLGWKYISDAQFQQRIPYYKAFYVQTPSGAGSSTCYFRSVMDINLAELPPSSRTFGRSADSIGSSVSIYDMGAVGVTN